MNIFIIFQTHLYALAASYALLLWIISYILNKKYRRSIMRATLLLIPMGPLAELMHWVDWWYPNYLFNTPIHIEDLVFAGAIGGVTVSLYCLLRNWMVSKIKNTRIVSLKTLFIVAGIALLLFFVPFYFLGVSSFETSLLSLGWVFLFGAWHYPRYILPMVVTGVVLMFLFVPGYLLGISWDGEWIAREWYLDKLSGILIKGIPIEELAWYVATGMGLSGYQEIVMRRD